MQNVCINVVYIYTLCILYIGVITIKKTLSCSVARFQAIETTVTYQEKKEQYVSSYILMRHACVYAYWADANYVYILVRLYLSCTVEVKRVTK